MILVIGDVMLDRYWMSDITEISNDAPVPCVKIRETKDYPGGAANVANNVASLGHDVCLIGLTADDKNKSILQQKLFKNKVNSIFFDSLNATTTKLRIIAKDNQLLRVDFEDDDCSNNLKTLEKKSLTVDNLKSNKEIIKLLDETKVIIFSDYAKGALSNIEKIIQYINKSYNNIKILIDPKSHDYRKYDNVYLLKPNFSEVQQMLGECESIDDLHEKSKVFLAQNNIKNLLVTLGKDGMVLYRKDRNPYHVASKANDVFDVTGAGDTVLATIASSIYQEQSIEDAIHLATTAASIAVSTLGTACMGIDILNKSPSLKKNNLNKLISSNKKEIIQQALEKANKSLYIYDDKIDLIDSSLIKTFKNIKKNYEVLWIKFDKQKELTVNYIHNLDVKIEILKNLKSVDGILIE